MFASRRPTASSNALSPPPCGARSLSFAVAPDPRAFVADASASMASRSTAFGITSQPVLFHREMRLHHRRQHVVGRNYPVGRIGADPHRRPERPVGQRLHARARRIGAPELLQSLGIEDERHRPDPIPRPRLGVSQRARAESMDNLRASLVHQPLRHPPRAPSEVRVGGDAIEDRRPAPPGERKRDVRHEPRLESSVPQGIVQARQRDSVLSSPCWAGGGVTSVTRTPRRTRCRVMSATCRSRPPTPCQGATARASTTIRSRSGFTGALRPPARRDQAATHTAPHVAP